MTPLIMEFQAQKFRNDCGIAALSMLLNQPYRNVSEAATELKINWKKGMTDSDMMKVARHFADERPALQSIRSPHTWHITSDALLEFIRWNELEDLYNRK